MRIDPYNLKRTFEDWKNDSTSGIDGLNKIHSKLLLEYLFDMECGQNIARGSKKGSRSITRLNALRIKLTQIFKYLEERKINDVRKIDEKQITIFFNDMRKGVIKKVNGEDYRSVGDYVKDFKSFWHWYMKMNKKRGIIINDITEDLDTSKEENKFVYFTKEDLETLTPYFTPNEQTLMIFAFDTIIRSPTELANVKVSDLSQDYSELSISDEASKTYGRRIKLLLCKEALMDYVKRNKLKTTDYLFKFSYRYLSRKLKKIAKQVFDDRMTKGGKPFSQLSLYDFRHSGACYWRTGAYRSKIDALMYRGGWSNLEILNYYTKKLGMKDSIEKDDLLIDMDKSEFEKMKLEVKQIKSVWERLESNPKFKKILEEEFKK